MSRYQQQRGRSDGNSSNRQQERRYSPGIIEGLVGEILQKLALIVILALLGGGLHVCSAVGEQKVLFPEVPASPIGLVEEEGTTAEPLVETAESEMRSCPMQPPLQPGDSPEMPAVPNPPGLGECAPAVGAYENSGCPCPLEWHVVKHGDTLSKIARLYSVSLASLIRANPQFPNPNLIYSGDVVNIPHPCRAN